MNKRNDITLRFPGGKAKALTLSYDDGVIQDQRMIELLRPAGMKCTFNINAGRFAEEDAIADGKTRRMSAKQCLDTYTDDVCEVAIHGYNHPSLARLSSAAVCCDIVDDRRGLEAMFGRQIHGMAYPNGSVSDMVVDVLKLCGIYYSRTTISTEKFTIPASKEAWLRLPATCHHKNPRLMELCNQFLCAEPKREPMMFYLWGHTYEFDTANNWEVIEAFVEKMEGHEDIWYATNMEIYRAWNDFQNLEFSADGLMIHNPSLRSVWIANSNGEVFEIKSGENFTL